MSGIGVKRVYMTCCLGNTVLEKECSYAVVLVCGYCVSILQPEEGVESHLVTIQFKWNRQVTELIVHTVGIYTVGHITHMHTLTNVHSH